MYFYSGRLTARIEAESLEEAERIFGRLFPLPNDVNIVDIARLLPGDDVNIVEYDVQFEGEVEE